MESPLYYIASGRKGGVCGKLFTSDLPLKKVTFQFSGSQDVIRVTVTSSGVFHRLVSKLIRSDCRVIWLSICAASALEYCESSWIYDWYTISHFCQPWIKDLKRICQLYSNPPSSLDIVWPRPQHSHSRGLVHIQAK